MNFQKHLTSSAVWVFLSGAALGQPVAVVAPSPSADLLVAPISQDDPLVAPMFRNGRANLQPVSLLLSNQGGEPITGIVILTVTTDAQGGRHTSRDVTDSYMSGGAPVLGPGGTLLAIPTGIWIRPKEATAFSADAGAVHSLQHASDWVRQTLSSQVTISVDAVVFASGSVYGPDSTNFMQELSQRKQAAQLVLAAINGPSPDSVLSQMAHQHVHNGDWLAQWEWRWASDYLSTRGASQVLRAIRRDLDIPDLFRGSVPKTN